MSGIFGLFSSLIFITVAGGFLFIIITGLITWNRNNNSPRVTEEVVIVAKRTHVNQNNGASGTLHPHSSTTTSYYVTFSFADNARKEFLVSGKEYGLLAEGDVGELSHQGTRYLGFERF